MKYNFFVITLLLVSSIYINCEDKLKFVIEQYRHGARGTLSGKYLGDTTPEDNYWSGQLTGVGMRQHYLLGQELRKEYVEERNFLNPHMNFTEIYVRSTDYNRTLQSAESQLYGLYDLGTGPKIPQGINDEYLLPPYKGVEFEQIGQDALPSGFQPVPIHTVDHPTDAMLNPDSNVVCPNFDKHLDAWKEEPEQVMTQAEIEDNFHRTAQDLSVLLNQKITVGNFGGIMDNIQCNLNANKPVPKELMPGTSLYKQVKFVSDFYAYWNENSPVIVRLLNSNLFATWIKYLENNINNKSDLKWLMLSAHDSNLQYDLPALNITSSQCLWDLYFTGKTTSYQCNPKPQFAANLILELYERAQTPGDYYVKLKYNGEYASLCESSKKECDYAEFKSRLQQYIYSNEEYNKLCFGDGNNLQNRTEKLYVSEQKQSSFSYAIAIQIVILIILAAWSIILLINLKQHSVKERSFSQQPQQYTTLISA